MKGRCLLKLAKKNENFEESKRQVKDAIRVTRCGLCLLDLAQMILDNQPFDIKVSDDDEPWKRSYDEDD